MNENKTYETVEDIQSLVKKTESQDTTSLSTKTQSIIQLIRDKHL